MIKRFLKKIKNIFKNTPMHKCHWQDPLCVSKPRLFGCICGKGETTIQQAPTTPAPSASESAADIYKARLEYDPKIAALEMQQQQQYAPQQAALYQSLYNQYYPDVARQQQQTQQELYPQQSRILEAGAGSVLQNLQSPYQQQLSQGLNQQTLAQLQQPQTALTQAMGQQAMAGLQPSGLVNRYEQEALTGMTPTGYTPEQQSAIDSIRMRQAQGLSKQLRERSNLGGNLYGGRSQALESQGLQELAQRYSAEDVDRITAQRQQSLQNLMGAAQLAPSLQQQALSSAGNVAGLQTQQQQQALQNAMALQQQRQQAAIPYMQILYPQVGTAQPNIQPFQYQSAVPGADTLYNAMFQASQPSLYGQQKKRSTWENLNDPLNLWGNYIK